MRTLNKNVLIVGATGFLGRKLYEGLKDDYDVAGLSRTMKGPRFFKADITQRAEVDSIELERLDILIYAASAVAASPDVKEARKNFDLNVTGLINLLDYAGRKGVRHIVLCSSVAVYGALWRERIDEETFRRPDTYYGMSKYLADEILKEFCEKKGVIYSILRFSALYGPGQRSSWALPVFIKQALRDRKIVVFGKGERTQDYLYVDDAARAVRLALENKENIICNIGSGVRTTMSELAILVNEIFIDNKGEVIYNPSEKEDNNRYFMDISMARKLLGFDPEVGLRGGLKRIKSHMAGQR